jgi:hypothetical protein
MKILLTMLLLCLTTTASAEVILRVHAPQIIAQAHPQHLHTTHLNTNIMGEVVAVYPHMTAGPTQYIYICEQKRGIGGAIFGAVGGAVVGSKVGGDVGAVVGGIAGMVIGDDIQNSGKQVCGTRAVQMQTIASYTVKVKAWNANQFLGFYDVPMNHAPPIGSYVKLGM